jgi:hypothetical protein
MNSRERFHATFNYDQPDKAFLMSQWTFNETKQRWLINPQEILRTKLIF